MDSIPPTDRPIGSTQPLHILRGRLGWRVRISEVDWAEPVSLVMQAVPEFPGCAANLPAADIVWDLGALLASVIRPGAHQLLNCTCGYAPAIHVGRVRAENPTSPRRYPMLSGSHREPDLPRACVRGNDGVLPPGVLRQ